MAPMPVDNQLYDRLSDTWWSEEGWLNLLRSALNPARFGYMRRVLLEDLGMDPTGKTALDVGCGGGLLAEEFARLGCAVTGVDPSEASLETARAHARESGLAIDYRQGTGEALPFEDASFDLVYCCDVLEHVDDVGRTVAEIARVLKPGGPFLYDTINRTRRSRLLVIKMFQEWPSTRLVDPDLHDWDMFIKPSELRAHVEAAGLEHGGGPVGMRPGNLLRAIRAMRARASGKIGYPEAARDLVMEESRDTSGSYMGWARKPA
jgi:2-polyprenyl-6-hydroxyphenyl methylase / 3-demethylubiquinone-9 3-methyltransferase